MISTLIWDRTVLGTLGRRSRKKVVTRQSLTDGGERSNSPLFEGHFSLFCKRTSHKRNLQN